MGARQSWVEELRTVPEDELATFLSARSGLPGPRANLELADAFAEVADRATILRFADLPDEYLRFCGTEAIGKLLTEEEQPSLRELLRLRSTDDSWRVREGAARALQILGDTRPDRMRALVAEWTSDDDPYVRRAAVAGICEPRLLTDPETCSAAFRTCRECTDSITALPADGRRNPPVRNLRQALGYCWSVVIAADPAQGLPAFKMLQTSTDPDVQWIVTSNSRKKRLSRLLEASAG